MNYKKKKRLDKYIVSIIKWSCQLIHKHFHRTRNSNKKNESKFFISLRA